MYRDIENFVRNCETCNVYQNKQVKEPLTQHKIPDRPWEKLGVDMFEFRNKNYLVTVDYYSNFFEVDRLYKTTSKHVIQKLRVQFSRHGIPSKVISDNGPQFSSSDFADFAKTYEFVHVTSSPG
jgi:transposase InsO family protein